jgi:hypothetical protein
MPAPPSDKPKQATITVKGLLDLIDEKCSKETCEALQKELSLLSGMLGVETPEEGEDPVPVTGAAFQLISNMVDSLKGDLTEKYPSAELLKKELTALWKCMTSKHTHHGEWADNWTYRDVVTVEDDNCLLGGGEDPAPDQIKVVTPVDIGSTVFHTVDGKHCLFESLVDDNTTEPSKASVLEGLWLNYCDLKEVIDCVLPRRIITDCHENCDDPNQDGVYEGKKLCERVDDLEECVICTVEDTDSVDLTKTNLPDGGASIKADIKLDPDKDNMLSVSSDGVLVLDTRGDLPAGAQTFVSGIIGTYSIVHGTTPVTRTATDKAGITMDVYEFQDNTLTLDPAKYKYLSVPGRKLVISGNASIGYWAEIEDKSLRCISPLQWGTVVYVDGKLVKSEGDKYAVNQSGNNSGLSDNFSFTVTTTGKPIAIKFAYVMTAVTDPGPTNQKLAAAGDGLQVDMGSATLTFTADIH